MSAIDKLKKLREQINSLENDIESKQAELESLKSQCSLALEVAEEFEKEIEELTNKIKTDKADEAEAFQVYIVDPLSSGDPDKQPDPLQYILARELPTPDSEAKEEAKEEVPQALAAAG